MEGMTWLGNFYVVFIIHFILPIGAFIMHNETLFTCLHFLVYLEFFQYSCSSTILINFEE